MAESVAVKADISFRRREFRKRILRMLVSISSNRSKRFDFSNDIQPGLNATAIGETPALQRKSNLQGVEQRNIEHGHEPVVTRVIQISQRVQARNADRSRQAKGEKTGLQLLERRRFKLFDFNPTKKKRKGIEIFMRVAHAGKNLFQTMAGARRDDAIDQQKKDERRPHHFEAEGQRSDA